MRVPDVNRRRLLAAGVLGLLGGCGTGQARQGDGRLRDDAGPLVRRFPVLGEPSRVGWMSGLLGDPRDPGPSSYWLDAAVWVTPPVAARLRDVPAAPGGPLPALQGPVQGLLPAGGWVASEALKGLFALQGWAVRVWFYAGVDVVAISAVGQ